MTTFSGGNSEVHKHGSRNEALSIIDGMVEGDTVEIVINIRSRMMPDGRIVWSNPPKETLRQFVKAAIDRTAPGK